MTTPTAVTNVSTPYSVMPYITTAEFKAAGTAVDFNSLVPGNSDPVAQDEALYGIIADATGWVHRLCDQMILGATEDTEIKRIYVGPKGELFVHPDNWPVLAVEALSYGSLPTRLQALTDLSGVTVETHGFTLQFAAAGFPTWSDQGPLQFGPPVRFDSQTWVTYTYVNGYANTLLAAPASVGDMAISVLDTTGMYAGITRLTIYDGADGEVVKVAGVAGGVVSLASPVLNDHAYNPGVSNAIRVSALPDQVKRATILLTAALIKTRGNLAIVMDSVGGGARKVLAEDETGLTDVAIAAELLEPFGRYK